MTKLSSWMHFFVVKVTGSSLKKTDFLFLLKIRSWQQGNYPEAMNSSLLKTYNKEELEMYGTIILLTFSFLFFFFLFLTFSYTEDNYRDILTFCVHSSMLNSTYCNNWRSLNQTQISKYGLEWLCDF